MKLADECESFSPAASASLRENFYMDDWVGGANSTEEAVKLQTDMRNVASAAGFHLRKFNSNDLKALEGVPEADVERHETVKFRLDSESPSKTRFLAGIQCQMFYCHAVIKQGN